MYSNFCFPLASLPIRQRNCNIVIQYSYSTKVGSSNYRTVKGNTSFELKTIFSVIATETMNVALTEAGIENALRSNLKFGVKETVHFEDKQLVKRLLNQFISRFSPKRVIVFL